MTSGKQEEKEGEGKTKTKMGALKDVTLRRASRHSTGLGMKEEGSTPVGRSSSSKQS